MSEKNGKLDTDMEWLDTNWIGSDNLHSNLNAEGNGVETNLEKEGHPNLNVKEDVFLDNSNSNEERLSSKLVAEHVDNGKTNGLLSFKARPTRKRLARMVYGSNESY